ncbi:hypothetical protein RRG08_004997 [Elysia crispata]|uniref:Uncharacterized protein n=1 Tax=Elysia crispata TaxID=231223 RepID=A0AAE1AUF0_9GAST|nr:hypothetical protein RRG08_004997 [Elysia crispata]
MGVRFLQPSGGSDLKSSPAFRKWSPGALLFLRDLMALMISSFVGGVLLPLGGPLLASWISSSKDLTEVLSPSRFLCSF